MFSLTLRHAWTGTTVYNFRNNKQTSLAPTCFFSITSHPVIITKLRGMTLGVWVVVEFYMAEKERDRGIV